MEIIELNSLHAEAYQHLRLEGLKKHPENFGASYDEELHYTIDDYSERITAHQSNVFGAFNNEKLIGIVTLFKESKLKMKHKAFIFGMYVTEESRGLGAARKLMEAALNKARAQPEIEQVYLTVMSANHPAKKLYLSLGFEPYAKEPHALKIGTYYYDEEHMLLML